MADYYDHEYQKSCGVGNHGKTYPNGLCMDCGHNPDEELEHTIPRVDGKHKR